MEAETLAKAYILTHGVAFTPDATRLAAAVNAKRQNMVYNAPAADVQATDTDGRASRGVPLTAASSAGPDGRPQELFLTGEDGYKTCASAVAPVPGWRAAVVDVAGDRLILATPDRPQVGRNLAGVEFVPQPAYYDLRTRSGRPVRRWVSACGSDEMNVWPWHDCAVGRVCSFCGINAVQKHAGRDADLLHALELRKHPDLAGFWEKAKGAVLDELLEAVGLAIDDECYEAEAHLILISGNLAHHQLDGQARMYADMAAAITARFPGRFAEGAVAVTAPPHDLSLLAVMRRAGFGIVVFNLEAYSPEAFRRYCPGKDELGRKQYLRALREAVEVFGWGRSWCNFVLGLEPPEDLLAGSEELAAQGITPGANVLHRDLGADPTLRPPDLDTVIAFYQELAATYRRHGHRPFYCPRALRTSLANEAFDGRLGSAM